VALRSGSVSIFPPFQQDEIKEPHAGERIVTDFVAGLTEDMAYELFHRLTGVTRGSILDAASRGSA
jgi:hypothetical protein